MGKSRKSPTQTTTNVPFSGQQPFLIDSFEQAKNLYDQGPQQFFGGSTVAGPSLNSKSAIDRLSNRSYGSGLTNTAQGFAQNQLQNNPQFAGAQSYQGAGPGFEGFANQVGAGDAISLDQANQQFSPNVTGLDPTASSQLRDTALGKYLNSNPFLDETFQRGADKISEQFTDRISPQISSQFSQAGRTGSDASLRAQIDASGEAGDALANFGNQVYGGNYQQERGRQLNAADRIGALDQNQQGLGLQAAGQGANFFNQGQGQDIQRQGIASNLFNADAGRDLSAAGIDAGVFGQQLNQQNNALGLANSLSNQDYTDILQQLNAGGLQEGFQQRGIDADRERFDFEQQAPQRALENYIAAIQGNYGGTTTSSSQTDSPGRFQRTAGGALAGSQFGLPGAILGGLGGLFGG